jgi:hypothetical protein
VVRAGSVSRGVVGVRPLVRVHVGLSTLVGVDDAPGWVDGYGPVTADVARGLAADPGATWRRLITDPVTQRLLAYDPRVYRVPAGIAGHVRRVAVCCTFPGCGRSAERCDLDHAKAHAVGGLTGECNLHPLCRRHHRAKHEAGWRPVIRDHGVDWTSPQGRTYRVEYPYRLNEPIDQPPDEPPDEAIDDDGVFGDGVFIDDRPSSTDWSQFNSRQETAPVEPPASPIRPTRDDPPPF